MIGLVAEGLGVAIVPRFATSLADPMKTSWRELNKPVSRRRVSIIRRADKSVSPALEAFVHDLTDMV